MRFFPISVKTLNDSGIILASTLLFIGVSFALTRLPRLQTPVQPAAGEKTQPGEISQIKALKSVDEQKVLYRKLIERVGPLEAQELLYRSGLPFDGQTHLLNHTVGDYLYAKFDTKGLVQCKDYFLSSCYHGFILNAMAKANQQEAVISVMQTCQTRGPTTVVQCAHAMGHGFLAWFGYANIPKALSKCDEVSGYSAKFPIFSCYDGIFMENVWAVHNGSPAPDRWVKEESATYPCDDPRIGGQYRGACWSNQPSLLFIRYQGDVGKVAEVCSALTDEKYKSICHNGLARQIHPLTGGSPTIVINYCNKIKEQIWRDKCIIDIAVSAYSVGDRRNPYSICNLIDDRLKSDCYTSLFGVMQVYGAQSAEANRLCAQIADTGYRQSCTNYQWK